MFKLNKNIKNKFNNIGFYIEYSLINPNLSYEYVNETSFMIRNIDRSETKLNNIFEWNNKLDNKIKQLLYIYIHIVSIPISPWLDKILNNDFDINFIQYLILNSIIDTPYTYNDIIYEVVFKNDNIIDFMINNIYSNCYSLELNTNNIYLYTRSNKKIYYDSVLYLDIDINDNLTHNTLLDTHKEIQKFNFKLYPISYTHKYIYYKAYKQYILKTINTIKSLDTLTINIYDSTYKKLSNTFINSYLYGNKEICDCIENKKPSCYCTYIRHPLNINNQIDISFRIGTINNELINNVFH